MKKDRVPIVSQCAKCGNSFTTQTHMEYPDKSVPKEKKIYVHFDGPSYSVHCASCDSFTVFTLRDRDNMP